LFVFLLVDPDHFAFVVEDHEAGTGRTLIHCGCIFSHFLSPDANQSEVCMRTAFKRRPQAFKAEDTQR